MVINISISNHIFKVYSLINYVLIEHLLPCFSTSSFIYDLLWGQSTVYPQFSSSYCFQFNHSVLSDSAIPWAAEFWASLSITNSWSFLKLMSMELVMPSNHLILCRPLLFLPLVFPSIRVFSNESAVRITWPKYWSFSLSISPSNVHPGLISFRMDWLDLLAVQGTLKSLF